MRGFPHQGKIYGFYDPTVAEGIYSETGPFNPNFLASLRTRRGPRLEAFNAYRKSLDPNGLFYNEFLRELLEGWATFELGRVAQARSGKGNSNRHEGCGVVLQPNLLELVSKIAAGQTCIRARLLVVPTLRSKITASAAADRG